MFHYNWLWQIVCSILFKRRVGLLHLAVELIQKIGDYACLSINRYHSRLLVDNHSFPTRPEVITTCLLVAQPIRGAHGSLLHCIGCLQSYSDNNNVPARDTSK